MDTDPNTPDIDDPALDATDPDPTPAAAAPEDGARAAVKKANDEAKRYRLQLRELEAQVKSFQDEKLSETERATQRAASLEADLERSRTQIRDAYLAADVTTASTRLGIIDADTARILVTPHLEYGDDGRATNLEDALASLVEAKPYLKASSDTPSARAGLKPQPPKNPADDAGPRETDAERRHRILSGGGILNPFSPDAIKALGGGVFLDPSMQDGE